MKILVVSQHYKPEPFNVSETCEALVGLGHKVTVLTGLPNYPEGTVLDEYKHGRHRDEVVDGVRVVRVPVISRGGDLSGFNRFRRIANYASFPLSSHLCRRCYGDQYDIVICFQFSPVLMALPALKVAGDQGIPCMIWCFDLWPEDLLTGGFQKSGKAYKAMRTVSQRIYGRASLIAVTSPGFKEYFANELGLAEKRYVWLPQYADEIFENMKPFEQSGKSEHAILTFAGNIGGNQGVETIVRAAAMVKKTTKLRIKIAGTGSCYKKCLQLKENLDASNIEFLGRLPLERMPGLYASSDAMILSLAGSDNDSLVPYYTIPRKFQSYLAASKPLIVSAGGTVAKIVEESGCGIACRPNDAVGLADAMKQFALMGKSERNEMAIKARQLYDAKFSKRAFLAELDQTINTLVEENGWRS